MKFDAKTAPDVQGTPGWRQHTCAAAGLQRYPGPGGFLPSAGASADNVTVIPGYTSAEALQQAISHAAGDTKNNQASAS